MKVRSFHICYLCSDQTDKVSIKSGSWEHTLTFQPGSVSLFVKIAKGWWNLFAVMGWKWWAVIWSRVYHWNEVAFTLCQTVPEDRWISASKSQSEQAASGENLESAVILFFSHIQYIHKCVHTHTHTQPYPASFCSCVKWARVLSLRNTPLSKRRSQEREMHSRKRREEDVKREGGATCCACWWLRTWSLHWRSGAPLPLISIFLTLVDLNTEKHIGKKNITLKFGLRDIYTKC